jgi:hypothetical protein
MWRRSAQLLCFVLTLGVAGAQARAAEGDPPVLTKAEFQAVAVEGLKSANGISHAEAAGRFAEILDAARTYPGTNGLARRVRTGYGHYQKSKNIRKKHVEKILEVFATAQVASLSPQEASAVLSAWPEG